MIRLICTGSDGTVAFLVNGKRYSGAVPPDTVEQIKMLAAHNPGKAFNLFKSVLKRETCRFNQEQ